MEFKYAKKTSQWGLGEGASPADMYEIVVPAKLLAEKAIIDRRTPDSKKGYQRELSPGRLGTGKTGVAGYLINQLGVFPTNILVNVRLEKANLKFSKSEKLFENIEVGTLEIPDEADFYVMDGQHRLEGLKAAMRINDGFEEYPIAVTVTNFNSFWEMLVFYLVNSRQNGVQTDLVYRILQMMLYNTDSPEWVENVIMKGADRRKAIAAEIVDHLNDDLDSPFKGNVQQVGETHKTNHIVKDGTLAKYIAEILKSEIFTDMYDKEVSEILAKYWSGIHDVYPECFERHEDYMLLKTFGLSSLSRLFPVIYGYCANEGTITRECMAKYIGYLKEETKDHKDPDFQRPITAEKWWHSTKGPGITKGTGEGLYRDIKEKFADKIKLVVKVKRGEVKNA